VVLQLRDRDLVARLEELAAVFFVLFVVLGRGGGRREKRGNERRKAR
jgi:hypothetical protein